MGRLTKAKFPRIVSLLCTWRGIDRFSAPENPHMSTDRITNSTFAAALRTLGRGSIRASNDTAEKVDNLFDPARRVGQEVNDDGFVSNGEMYTFAAHTYGPGQGLSAQEKRLGQAARVLHEALTKTNPGRLILQSNARPVDWRKEVPLASLSGMVQVKNGTRVVLETDRKALAQKLAGPGQPTIGPDDFKKALPYLSLNERYLAHALLNELYFDNKSFGPYSSSATTPGGRPLRLETTQTGSANLAHGGMRPPNDITWQTTAWHALELTLTSREVLINTNTGETFAPDRSGKVKVPVAASLNEFAIVTRGVSGTVKEKFTLSVEGGAAEAGHL
jgi:hypothetical protein